MEPRHIVPAESDGIKQYQAQQISVDRRLGQGMRTNMCECPLFGATYKERALSALFSRTSPLRKSELGRYRRLRSLHNNSLSIGV